MKGEYNAGGQDWVKIVEHLNETKKKMQKEEPEKYDNRMAAKDMTHSEFKDWYRNAKKATSSS